MVLAGLVGNIRDVFKMTRLDKIFSVYDDAGAAVSAVSA